MHTRELVQSIASTRKAKQDVQADTWRKLGERIFYVPLQTVRNADDAGGAKKIRFFVEEKDSRRIVPTFSTEELLFEWSSGGFQFLPIAGADLVLALPKGLSLELDPGSDHQVTLGSIEFDLILSEPEAESEPIEVSNKTISEPEEVPEEDSRPPVSVTLPDPPKTSEVENRIATIVKMYPAVAEAYFLGSEGSHYGGLLGLLISGANTPESNKPGSNKTAIWDTEQRFSLVEAIAELARELYGYAGAIEVYDDLANESSRSWDLFKSQQLFYRHETEEEAAPVPASPNANTEAKPRNNRPTMSLSPGPRLRFNERK